MPFSANPPTDCKNCQYELCVSYIREQSKRMKDRNTLYRLAQKKIMACTFEDGIPGFNKNNLGLHTLSNLVNTCVRNGIMAGEYIEKEIPAHFGQNVESAFSLTPGQIGKVRGDIFEMLSRAILWNTNLCLSNSYIGHIESSISDLLTNNKMHRYAAITLGDNYDLKRLFNRDASNEFQKFEQYLASKGTSFCYSTPDLVVIRCNDQIWSNFSHSINDLSIPNQDLLSSARLKIEGKISPDDIVLAAGIKTSIRSDRMYQLLFEANAWKSIWRKIYDLEPSKYYSLIGQSYGADPNKLNSVEFTSISSESGVNKAIDGLVHFSTPRDLITWYVDSID